MSLVTSKQRVTNCLMMFAFSNWRRGEPNDVGRGEPCIQVYASGEWNDIPCRLNTALCEHQKEGGVVDGGVVDSGEGESKGELHDETIIIKYVSPSQSHLHVHCFGKYSCLCKPKGVYLQSTTASNSSFLKAAALSLMPNGTRNVDARAATSLLLTTRISRPRR